MTLGQMMNRHHQLVRRLCNAAAGRGRARRVVVTGMGLVTCLGVGTDHVWPRLLAGECGITALDDQKYSGIPSRVAGLVPRGDEIGQLNLDNHMSQSERRMMSLASSYALVAASEALRQAHWSPSTDEEKYQTGVAVGMGMVDLDEIVETGCTLQGKGGYRKVNPYFVPHILVNMAAGHISLKFSLKGVNHAVSTACTTGVHAIGDASRFITHGDVDVMVCGGAEAAVTPLAMAGFARMRALSTSFNDRPTEASRPFDRDRNGFVMAEGAGILVLEELEHALARNAVIYGEILGYGLSGDANHVSSPSANGDGAYRCMQAALRDANADVSELGYINAHATSTPLGDDAESKAIAHLLGSHSPNVLVSSTKGAVGHMLGAAGAVEAIFTVMACNTAMSPPTINCHNPNTEPCLNYVQNSAAAWQRKAGDRKVALTNSFGFGGTNASLCVAGFSRPSSAKHYFI